MKKLLKYSLASFLSMQALCAFAQGVTPFAEVLVWHAQEQPASAWTNVISGTEFGPENNNFGWDPGFRGGFVFHPDKFFDLSLYWTYFGTDSRDTIDSGPYIFTPGFFSGYLSENIFFSAQSDWHLTLNMVDLELSHSFEIAKNISLTPFVGLKAAVIDQSIDADWYADIYTSTEKVKNDFWGLGPSFGFAGQWDLTKEFNFVAEFAAAFLWGEWEMSDVYERPYLASPIPLDGTIITTEINDQALGTLMLRYFVGVQWAPQALNRVTFELGYEMQYWANQVRLLTFQELPTHGDLTIQGGTCGFAIDLY